MASGSHSRMKPPTLPEGYAICAMSRDEAEVLLGWAAAEGWNPGLADLEVSWSFDPQGFIALRYAVPGKPPELVGGGAILSYGGQCGFMGLFIMRADHRGQGLGRVLWHERLRRLQCEPGAVDATLREGAIAARAVAATTMAEVRERAGLWGEGPNGRA